MCCCGLRFQPLLFILFSSHRKSLTGSEVTLLHLKCLSASELFWFCTSAAQPSFACSVFWGMQVKCLWNAHGILSQATYSLHIQIKSVPPLWHRAKVAALKKQQGPKDLLVCQARFRKSSEAITAGSWSSVHTISWHNLIRIMMPSFP